MNNSLRLSAMAVLLAAVAAAALGDGMIVPVRPDIRVRGSWAVKYHHVKITVRDQVASVTIEQEFVNTSSGMIEVEYLFPIPPDAAIDSMTLIVNGKEFGGKLMKADEARKIYEDIVRRKKDPALLEYVGFGLFRTRAFPLEPGKPIKVVVHYTNVCQKDGEMVKVWYPLNTEKFSSKPIESVKVVTDIKSKADLTTVYSPTHELTVKHKGPRHVIATYEAKKTLPTTDFLLYYRADNRAVGATLLTYSPDAGKDGYFLLLVSPNPNSGGAKKAIPKDVVVVLDHSGSMSGEKIDQAKEALAFIVKNLNARDRFSVVAYNDAVEPFFDRLVKASNGNVASALDQIDRLEPSGGTNIRDALCTALKMFDDGKRPGYVIFLTDGIPTVGVRDEKTILKDARKAGAENVRVFAFGVGYDVNVRLLDKLVRDHNGRSDYVREKEPVEPKVSSLYAKIKNPVMTGLKVEIAGVRLRQAYPRRLGDLFDGDQIIVAGRYDCGDVLRLPKRDGAPSAQLVVTGTYEGKSRGFEYPAQFRLTGKKPAYSFVEKIWAMRRIGYLLDEIQLNGKSKELIDELVQLSLKHGIITPYTSFLADDREGRPAPTPLMRRELASKALAPMKEVTGTAGQRHAMNRQALSDASVVMESRVDGGAVQFGYSKDDAYDKGAKRKSLGSVRNAGGKALYRRGRLWVTPETEKLDLEKDAGQIRTIDRYSKEYFELARKNTVAENQLLATQRDSEELLVKLRGQVYRIR